MRKLITFILAVMTFSALADSKGVVTGTTLEGFQAPENIAYNGGFELSSGTAGSGWTASAGTFAISTSSPLRGSKSATWDASATSQTLSSKLVAIPSGMLGVGALASCQIKVASGTATHTFSVTDGTNTLGTATVVSSSVPAVTSIPFQMPTSGSVRIVLTSNADEPSIQVDDCFLGAIQIDKVSQPVLYGTLKTTGGSTNWSTTSSTFADLGGTVTGLTYAATGNIESPTTAIPAFRMRNAPPGNYLVVVTNVMQSGGSATNCAFRITDGTYTSLAEGSVEGGIASPATYSILVTAPISDSTFKIQAKRTGGTGSCNSYATTAAPSVFMVYRYPLQTEQVVRADVLSGLWGSRYFPDSTGGFTTTSASYASVTAANLFAATTNKGSAVACTDANAICIKMPQLLPGSYKIDYSGSAGNSSGSQCSFAIYDGSSDYELLGSTATASTNYGYAGSTVINYDSVQTNKEFTLRLKMNGGVGCGMSSTYYNSSNLTITPLSQQLPVPVYVGSVTSGSTGMIRVESALVAGSTATSTCAASPCTIYRESSPGWLGVTRSAGGTYSLNFTTGVFSSTPNCFLNTGIKTNLRHLQYEGNSATQGDVTSYTTAAALSDIAFEVICMGPR